MTQFTYFQQFGGLDLDLIPAEITYGLERLAMFLQGKRSAFELEWAPGVTWGDVYRESERQWSTYNFEHAPVETLMRRFAEHEAECGQLLEARLPLPAYDQVLKCSHAFNLLDARGAISVTERAAYIGRVRAWRGASRSSTWRWRAQRTRGGGRPRACRRCCLRSAARSCRRRPAGRRRRSCRSSAATISERSRRHVYIGPRRLTVVVDDLPERTPDEERRGPAERIAFDDDEPTKAAEGFARGLGLTVAELERA